MKALFVGGDFDDGNGKESKIAEIMYQTISRGMPGSPVQSMTYFNGGNFSQLEELVSNCGDYGLIFWFPKVPDEKSKIVGLLKEVNPEHVLVTSKNNMDGRYSFGDLMNHALNIHSNLFVEFTRRDGLVNGRVIDPLGNVFQDYCSDFDKVSCVALVRANELLGYQRIRSHRVEGEPTCITTPEQEEFLELVRYYAKKFHSLIHPAGEAKQRMMGNASFRCEYGFPSFRTKQGIFVSKRNIDKREISIDSFVLVKDSLPVEYYGAYKPSVDTPLQILLYWYYPLVNYILHSHTYIRDAEFSRRIIPCGAIDEAEEITRRFEDRRFVDFGFNLLGHGSIFLSSSTRCLNSINYYPREVPEICQDYDLWAEEKRGGKI